MKLTDTNISMAIHTICDAYKALPDNGFRLCIEDKSPEGFKVAGQQKPAVTIETREISEDDLPESVKKALGLGGIQELIEKSLPPETPPSLLGVAIPKELVQAAGWDGEIYDSITLFYEPLVKGARDEDELKRLAVEFTRHEWRHGCQFNWLRDHGVDVLAAISQENQTVYGEGPLESDAHKFQWDEADDINDAMASFIA